MKKTARLEQWKLTKEEDGSGIYHRLEGIVYNHKIIPDGHNISTSVLVNINEKIAETQNTVYELGIPLMEYN